MVQSDSPEVNEATCTRSPFMYYDGFLASFDTHDMKPMQSMCKLLYAVFDLSTLMDGEQ